MAARTPAFAKLTRPRLYDPLARPRLFTLLDDAATRPIVWISAPPGAGKSALVASYVEARKRPCLWYNVDAADGDPPTFLHYMRIAAQQLAGKRAASLPVFTSEPQQDLGRFLRGFCRDLFSVLPPHTVVVLDNFDDARAPTAQRAAFVQGLEEIPEGITVVVTSRTDPPDESSRTASNGHAKVVRRPCPTGSRRFRPRFARPTPGSNTGSDARGSSCSPIAAESRLNVRMRRSVRATTSRVRPLRSTRSLPTTTTSGRTSFRSTAGSPSSSACSRTVREVLTARANCEPGPRT